MDSIKQKYQSVREEGVRNKAQSIRGDGFRNKATSMIKGEKTPAHATHNARPISELRDPSSFGPPPRRTTAPGGRIERPPPPYRSSSTASKPAPPSLPPRLPPRSHNSPVQDPYINQSAAARLGASGVSVPDLGISRSASAEPVQEQGTSWEQKRTALRTVSDFQRDPSSVSLRDARGAASTANNFRERHGDQVARGMTAAGNLDQRYGLSEHAGAVGGTAAGLAGKKKPPPPPPKRNSLAGGSVARNSAGNEPPPLPMSTKPRF